MLQSILFFSVSFEIHLSIGYMPFLIDKLLCKVDSCASHPVTACSAGFFCKEHGDEHKNKVLFISPADFSNSFRWTAARVTVRESRQAVHLPLTASTTLDCYRCITPFGSFKPMRAHKFSDSSFSDSSQKDEGQYFQFSWRVHVKCSVKVLPLLRSFEW